jgi:hypothetical protein
MERLCSGPNAIQPAYARDAVTSAAMDCGAQPPTLLEAGRAFLDRPRQREAACGWHGARIADRCDAKLNGGAAT